jgi:rhamnopyranosyl-N-acetylglucosaminyl-diphospho-decaprenol beta-1,3/1,4-galactofuranosyltransferase
MRVLAHIHTMNDAAVIEQVLDGLRRQTRPPDAIVIVDNGSTDATLDRTFPENASIVRNRENLGTSGAIRLGFAHALQHGFDWTWVFDADSVPEPDALERLLAFFQRLSPLEREQVCFLACRLVNAEGEIRHEPVTFTGSTVKRTPVEGAADNHIQCDYFTWTGSLFRMPAVAKIGLPSADYVLDVAEVEYGYRARQLGLTSYMIRDAVTHQDVGRSPGIVTAKVWRIGRWRFAFRDAPPIRAYYASRNHLYFWLYQCKPLQPRRVFYAVVHALLSPIGFVLRPVSCRRQLIANLRGLWDGLTAHMERRY